MDLSNVVTVVLVALLVWQVSRMFLGKVSPQKAKELVAEGARLVDVRTPGEHKQGHIEGSINIPVQDLGSRLSEVGDKAKPVVVYCASGARSASAAGALKRAGYTVYDLGSIARWPG